LIHGAPTLQLQTVSAQQTLEVGTGLGKSLVGGLVIALVGALGAGKTQFVKGMAIGNGACDARCVTSPTFTLINEYAGRLTLFHLDAYRLSGPVELFSLGFDELMAPDSAVVVEWADRVAGAIPAERLQVHIEAVGASVRGLSFWAYGSAAESCLGALCNR